MALPPLSTRIHSNFRSGAQSTNFADFVRTERRVSERKIVESRTCVNQVAGNIERERERGGERKRDYWNFAWNFQITRGANKFFVREANVRKFLVDDRGRSETKGNELRGQKYHWNISVIYLFVLFTRSSERWIIINLRSSCVQQ